MITRDIFDKKIKDMTPEEMKQYWNITSKGRYQRKDAYKTSWTMTYFGKRHKDLTPEEKREFNRIQKRFSRKG